MGVSNPNPRVGAELAYATATASQTLIQASVDLAGLTITFSTDGPCFVEGRIAYFTHTTAGSGVSLVLTDENNVGTDLMACAQAHSNGASCGTARVIEHIAAAGTYTRKLRATAANASATMIAAATSPAFIRAVRC